MILLDTNAWLWWTIRPEGMPARARSLADAAAGDGALAVSVVSVWEIAVKTALRKLQLGMAAREWVARATRAPGLRILPVDSDIALASAELPPPLPPGPRRPAHRRPRPATPRPPSHFRPEDPRVSPRGVPLGMTKPSIRKEPP